MQFASINVYQICTSLLPNDTSNVLQSLAWAASSKFHLDSSKRFCFFLNHIYPTDRRVYSSKVLIPSTKIAWHHLVYVNGLRVLGYQEPHCVHNALEKTDRYVMCMVFKKKIEHNKVFGTPVTREAENINIYNVIQYNSFFRCNAPLLLICLDIIYYLTHV